MSELLALLALQRVIVERPPAGTLRRGLFAAPPALAAALATAALAAMIGVAWTRRRRGPR